ncbi:hypothetical protein OK016_23375 [Vibrio chagasii]|nr:hypothetical protein [Vibrio chagasii]
MFEKVEASTAINRWLESAASNTRRRCVFTVRSLLRYGHLN